MAKIFFSTLPAPTRKWIVVRDEATNKRTIQWETEDYYYSAHALFFVF